MCRLERRLGAWYYVVFFALPWIGLALVTHYLGNPDLGKLSWQDAIAVGLLCSVGLSALAAWRR